MGRYKRSNYRGINRRFGLFNFRWPWMMMLLVVGIGLFFGVLPVLLLAFVLYVLFVVFGRRHW